MQKILRFLIRLVLRLIARVEIHGIEHLPAQGGFILAANHLGRLDSAILYYAIEREDVIMPVAEKYKHHWLFGWLVPASGGFFINRFDADLAAIREILRRMKQGGIFVIAPEGTRSKTEALQKAHSGVAFFAVKTGAPVVPVALTGTEDRLVVENLKHFRRSHIVVRAAKPIQVRLDESLGREAALEAATDDIMCRIAAMLPEKYRGVYANHPRLERILKSEATTLHPHPKAAEAA
ncbi:MAG: 1-acyl-sn-glycerol-3-phosphate acyltransferase [Anaerolineales bacterium]|nr:1-acyl-sn-glycerol-3-phosphate acyltransferase [Anaerolineales bacterium]MCX7756577.1 1-acyl-sn-glycerol-3-phosphate acyltransferase [Anaerolineales bacterium]MDW8278627.1 lysophospholipid acyltransferase family protein [Anaerolineales bacterium]